MPSIRSAITVSLVPEARGGPFVFWDDLEAACRSAAEIGFDAIEIFAPSSDAVNREQLAAVLQATGLSVAAVGTGAGMVKHGLTLIDLEEAQRQCAFDFVRSIIEFGAAFGAPAIIGSMQGKWSAEQPKEAAVKRLAEALAELSSYAAGLGQVLIYEPLNRYETNLFNTVGDAAQFLSDHRLNDVRLLADLFHMNIEEVDIAEALAANVEQIGHIHFVDSNRRAAGMGHMDFGPIAAAIKKSGYRGYLSAEALPLPDSVSAAKQTLQSISRLFA